MELSKEFSAAGKNDKLMAFLKLDFKETKNQLLISQSLAIVL